MLTCSSTSSNILTLLRPQRVFIFGHSYMYTRDFPLETIFHATLLNQPASTTDRHTDIIFFTNSVTHSQIDNDDDRLRNTFNLNTLGGRWGKIAKSFTQQQQQHYPETTEAVWSVSSLSHFASSPRPPFGPPNRRPTSDRLPYLIPTPNVRTHQNRHTITLATEIYVFLCLPQYVLDRENVCDRAECRGA